MELERLSIELSNRCAKACAFCYSKSGPAGETRWTVDDVERFVADGAGHGVRAVSFGGGEPLEVEWLPEILMRLKGVLFRSVTTNGLLLYEGGLERLVAATPDKVHVSIHDPARGSEVERVIRQVTALSERGIRSGVNLLVSRTNVEAATGAGAALREAGIGNDRIVYLPMRIRDTPTVEDLVRVAGSAAFQSMSCLLRCGASPRFCSVAWDRTAAWCSYTSARRPLHDATYAGLTRALSGLPVDFCGGTDPSFPEAPRAVAATPAS
ncbi:MAG: radical SAM protein [Acidobacteriota bacterium]